MSANAITIDIVVGIEREIIVVVQDAIAIGVSGVVRSGCIL